jgi:aminoglycoside 3-N-acetyltransferase I
MADAIEIHHLTQADLASLRALNTLFAEAFDDRESYAGAPPDDACLMRLLGRDHFIALVAVEAGRVVGGLAAYELEKFEQTRSEVYIYDLAVAEDCRRRGIATRLINRLREISAERGAWVIYVQADHVDPPAIALYTGLGVREDVLHFDIAVDAPRGSAQ